MSTNEQSVTLLRKNKRAQVEAFNSVGFNLTEGARASQFPELVKWAAGLLDVTIAANRKRDNRKFFFTLDEWKSLSSTEHEMFLLRGVRVRACGQSFVIAPDNIPGKTWGSNKAVGDAHGFTQKRDLYRYYEADTETNIVIAAYADVTSGAIIGAPAAEAAVAYKAFTLDRDGYEDDTPWCLPTLAHLNIIRNFRPEIEAVITSVWSSDFKFLNQPYWSCCNYSTEQAYYLGFSSGESYPLAKSSTNYVRPISLT